MGKLTSTEVWQSAVRGYWAALDTQATYQGVVSGVKDAGNRAAVTGGKQMNTLQEVVGAIWQSDPDIQFEVRSHGQTNLPAYFRASKNWDLLVLYRDSLVAAMEFKSQRGPSFGNNFNNRTEEALGLAADSQMAVEKGLFGHLKPWFGYLMLVQSAKRSTSPVKVPIGMPFPADSVFRGASYIDRYRIFFERMVTEGNYDAVALVTAEEGSGDFFEPSVGLSLANLEAAILARITYIKALPDDVFDRIVR